MSHSHTAGNFDLSY